MINKNAFLDVFLVVCWAYLFGAGSKAIEKGSFILEFSAVAAGISIGIFLSWGIRSFRTYLLKNESKQ